MCSCWLKGNNKLGKKAIKLDYIKSRAVTDLSLPTYIKPSYSLIPHLLGE